MDKDKKKFSLIQIFFISICVRYEKSNQITKNIICGNPDMSIFCVSSGTRKSSKSINAL